MPAGSGPYSASKATTCTVAAQADLGLARPHTGLLRNARCGIHMIDLVLWLSAERPVEVIAYGSSLASAGTGFRGTDLVFALLRFESDWWRRWAPTSPPSIHTFNRLVVPWHERNLRELSIRDFHVGTNVGGAGRRGAAVGRQRTLPGSRQG